METPPPPRFIVADLVGRGHLFGLVPALDGDPHVAQLEAVTRTRTMFVPRQAFLDELTAHPDVCMSLTVQLVSFLRMTESWLVSSF